MVYYMHGELAKNCFLHQKIIQDITHTTLINIFVIIYLLLFIL